MNLTCPHCGKTFKMESRLLAHQCKEKTRFEIAKTLPGARGYNLYVKWFTLQSRGTPSKDAFLVSKYFNAFVEFAKFISRVKMSDPDFYIRSMIRKNFPPEMWRLDATYTMYLESIVYNMPPIEQISKTIRFLDRMCDKAECDYVTLINTMEASELLFFIRQGEITPWILMHSMKIKEVFMDPDHEDEYAALKQLIKPAYWKYKFGKQPDMVRFAKSVVTELGL